MEGEVMLATLLLFILAVVASRWAAHRTVFANA